MATWADIVDGAIDAYSPITAKLITRLRNHDQLNRQQVLSGTQSDFSTVSAPASWTTIGSIRVYVPDCYVGPSGTRLDVFAAITVTAAGSASATFRLEVGGTTSSSSAVITTGGTDTNTNAELTLDWTPTADAIATINVQTETTGSPTNVRWQWQRNRSDAYLANLPRSS